MPEKYTVHDFAESAKVELDPDLARVFSATLCLISERKGLMTCTKRHRTTKPNPNYPQELDGQRGGQGVTPRKNIGQSYFVKAFDRSLEYYFKQLCILLIETP
jgi:hypothetical protein